MENKKLLDGFLLFSAICTILLVILLYNVVAGGTANALAGVSVGDYLLEKAIVQNQEIEWTQEMENKRLEALKPKPVEKETPKIEKQQEEPKKVTEKPITVAKKNPASDIDVGTKIKLSDEVQIVACLNEKNMTIHQPKNGSCSLGQGGKWKNIMLPPKSHIEHFKKIFGDDYRYRLAIANYEGSFKENAQNPYAIGYLQTLRSHKVKPDIVSQLNWLKNREDKNTGVACDRYTKENFTLFGTMNIEASKLAKQTCMARRHYGAFNPGDGKHYHHSVMYAKRYKATTEYYLSLSF